MYLAVPVLLYGGERTLRYFRSGSYSVRLLKVSEKQKLKQRTLFSLLSHCLVE
jgi:hypothetical protein